MKRHGIRNWLTRSWAPRLLAVFLSMAALFFALSTEHQPQPTAQAKADPATTTASAGTNVLPLNALPEVPYAILLPLVGLSAAALLVVRRGKRST